MDFADGGLEWSDGGPDFSDDDPKSVPKQLEALTAGVEWLATSRNA
ncbi:MAG TPA: hypothetical protein VGC89_12600 [Pyrinomonadaceae bacterium]